MFFLPVTLIITLTASLLVAYIINPVFAVSFMKPDNVTEGKPVRNRRIKIVAIITGSVALLCYISGSFGMGNFAVTIFLVYLMYQLWMMNAIRKFQEKIWPAFTNGYKKILGRALEMPWKILGGTVFLFFFTIVLLYVRAPG